MFQVQKWRIKSIELSDRVNNDEHSDTVDQSLPKYISVATDHVTNSNTLGPSGCSTFATCCGSLPSLVRLTFGSIHCCASRMHRPVTRPPPIAMLGPAGLDSRVRIYFFPYPCCADETNDEIAYNILSSLRRENVVFLVC